LIFDDGGEINELNLGFLHENLKHINLNLAGNWVYLQWNLYKKLFCKT